MTTTFDQLREARTALDTPLFAGLPGDIRVVSNSSSRARIR